MTEQHQTPLLHDVRRILVYVEDLDRAIAYYRDILGFKPLGGVDGVNFEFETSGPPLVVHRNGQASQNPHSPAGFVPSFQISNGIHDLVERYRQRGVRIVQGVLEVSHGWIAFISDLEGNVLQIYQTKKASV
jgi:predicted enzyme related to lactoylglutathione lyase